MSALPLFYTKPVPLDAKAHHNLSLVKNFGFDFANEVNAIPINLIEFPQICHYYPIAFSPTAEAAPVAILGLRDNENLYVDSEGKWEPNSYIPAYVRRYPFIFSEMPDGEQLTLCIDMVDGIIEEGGDQPFFDESGRPSELSNNALEFCKSYHAAAMQTQEFGIYLRELDLLIDREAQISVQGQQINFSGFSIINEHKLADLEDEAFLDLRKRGFLPFIYAHLFSGAQWQRVSWLMDRKMSLGSSIGGIGASDHSKVRSDIRPLRLSFWQSQE